MTLTRPSARYDYVVTALAFWMVFGVWLDGWGHHHGAAEDFFTPWHALLYSGYTALAIALVGYPMLKLRRGLRSVMPGYGAAAAGVWIFAVGGVGDMFWHDVFGIEGDVEAFISPPHMALFIGGTMMVLGPLAALRHRRVPATWRGLLPAVLAVANALGLVQFATEHANALLLPFPAGDVLVYDGPFGPAGYSFTPEVAVAYGLSAIIVQTLLVAVAVVLLTSRMRAPFGAITLTLVLGVGHSLVIHDELGMLLVLVPAGLIGDAIVATVSQDRLPRWVLPTLVPAVLYTTWLVDLAIRFGLTWNTHLVTGTVTTTTATGLIVGLLFREGDQNARRYRIAWRSARRRAAVPAGRTSPTTPSATTPSAPVGTGPRTAAPAGDRPLAVSSAD